MSTLVDVFTAQEAEHLPYSDRLAARQDAIDRLVDAIRRGVNQKLDAIDELSFRIKGLEEDGITEGVPYWKDGKYLTLVHPMNGGWRKREYIGSDPVKCQAALDRVKRTREHAKEKAILEALKRDIGYLRNELFSILVNVGVSSTDAYRLVSDIFGDNCQLPALAR